MRHPIEYLLIVLIPLILPSCGSPKKLEKLKSSQVAARLALSREEILQERKVIEGGRRDTIKVKDESTGEEFFLMHAVKDDNGEMVANEVINAAIITARFRNVAERHGRIDLQFEVIVPKEMQDSKWQLRFYPDMFVLEDSLRLESVVITGKDYRAEQLRGYDRYNRFLSSIVTDTSLFVNWRNLDIFIKRNIPQLYAFSTDTSFVSEERFNSFLGASAREALEHYTNMYAKRRNEWKRSRIGEMFRKYVTSPIITEGIRLDTVMQDSNNDYVYQYTQSIQTRPKLRKVDVILSGDIWEGASKLYEMNRSEPLTFYVSSISSFVDGSEKYLSSVISRRSEANTACYVDFEQGSWEIKPNYGNNRTEMGRICGNIRELLENEKYDLDSIVIAASASPEGTVSSNGELSRKRAASIARYFDDYVRHYTDSVGTMTVTVDSKGRERIVHEKRRIPFSSRSNGENWDMLTFLVDTDSSLSAENKRSFMRHMDNPDFDAREQAMHGEPYYRYMREQLYPRLRTVKFDFFLHRKGMIKDTVHTTVLDTVYMKGVQAIRDREYETALEYLRPYKDYNTAIAYVALDYNASAMSILSGLERTPQVNYMLALLYARNDDDEKAVSHYLKACSQDHSYVFRGNLDPEIFVLIQRYGLNREDDIDDIT